MSTDERKATLVECPACGEPADRLIDEGGELLCPDCDREARQEARHG